MNRLTHKMAADNDILNNSHLSVENSMGDGCLFYFPLTETDPDSTITDTGKNAIVITPTLDSDGTGAFTRNVNALNITPTINAVSADIGEDQAFMVYTMVDLSRNHSGLNVDDLLVNMFLGNTAGGYGYSAFAEEVQYYETAAKTIPAIFPAAFKTSVGLMIALLVRPYSSSNGGGRNFELCMFDGNEASGADRTIVVNSAELTQSGTQSVNNKVSVNGANIGGNKECPTYLAGAQIFTGDFHTTIYDELLQLRNRAILGNKALPAGWVTEIE